jgi:uncharacterized protein (DUF1800 family)
MELTRREVISVAALAGVATFAGCNRVANFGYNINREPILPPDPKLNPAVADLNRFGFGPNNPSLRDYNQLGREAWLQEQLNPTDQEPTHLVARLERLEIFHLGPWELRDWKEETILAQMQQAAILRAVYSPWQLRERMVDFWTNHFNIFAKKGLAVYRKPWDERDVIRKNALGNFKDMVLASAKSTAMLIYLDQQNSTKTHPNENYARELLELHTLGVQGGYTQRDVMEAARAFTGWSEERGFLNKKGAFLFVDEIHDKNPKTFLGHNLPGGRGIEDGEDVVNIVATHPSTARFITQKLCDYFLGDPTNPIQPQMEASFLATKGEIKPLVLLLANAFAKGAKPLLKRPFDFLASAIRAVDAATDGGLPVQTALAQMGQPLYMWPMPDGFPIEPAAWTSSLLPRWNFASQLLASGLPGTEVDLERLGTQSGTEIAFRRSAQNHDLTSLDSLIKSLPLATQTALALASPEFQWR